MAVEQGHVDAYAGDLHRLSLLDERRGLATVLVDRAGRDALRDEVLRGPAARIGREQAFVAIKMGMHVDEAGRDHPSAHVDFEGSRRAGEVAYGGNGVARDGHIGDASCRAGAIDHGAAAQDEVELACERGSDQRDEAEKQTRRVVHDGSWGGAEQKVCSIAVTKSITQDRSGAGARQAERFSSPRRGRFELMAAMESAFMTYAD